MSTALHTRDDVIGTTAEGRLLLPDASSSHEAVNVLSRVAASVPGPSAPGLTGRRFHLIGIGGSGMNGLAHVLLRCGAIVSGSDRGDSDTLSRLRHAGARVAVGQGPENLPGELDVVVASAAIHDENPELLAARQRGVQVLKYAAALGKVMQAYDGIAISGTHGKSTTTAMVAYTLKQANFSPSFVVGAHVEQLGGGSGVGAGRHFVAEACEFDRSFLNLRPRSAAILNVELDHLDCYKDIHAVTEAFRAFASLTPKDGLIVANGEDRNVRRAIEGVGCRVQTFGRAEGCDWRAIRLSPRRGVFSFDVVHDGKVVARPSMYLPGLHNVYNALACWALCAEAGVSPEAIVDGLATFRGAHRRLTIKGRGCGITVVDDYAHHPTEIVTTLKAARDHFQPRRLICVFQPHQHSRTRFLLEDFARSFTSADVVLVPDIYFVRDSEQWKDAVSAGDLVSKVCQHGGDAHYLPSFDRIVSHLKDTLREGDLLITMGAGNIHEVAEQVCAYLGMEQP